MREARFLAFCAFLFPVVHAARNVTVDENDRAIQYQGTWLRTNVSHPLNIGGFHELSVDKSATALFTFTGVAVYLMSPKWPYRVGARVSLDSTPAVEVDLQDYVGVNVNEEETVASDVVFSRVGLSNTQHTLGIRFPGDKAYLVLDAIIYTVQEDSDTTSSSPTSGTTSAPSSSPTSEDSDSSTNILPVALGGALGGLGLALLILALIFVLRRRHKQQQQEPSSYPTSFAGSSQRPPVSFIGSAGPGFDQNLGDSRVNSGYIVEPLNPSANTPGWGTYGSNNNEPQTASWYAPNEPSIGPISHPYSSTASYSSRRPYSEDCPPNGAVRMSYAGDSGQVIEYEPHPAQSLLASASNYPISPLSGSSQAMDGFPPYGAAAAAATKETKETPYKGYTSRTQLDSEDGPPTYRPR